MTAPHDDWPSLADHIVARRLELGMPNRRDLAAAAGISERTLSELENGRSVRRTTLAAVESALQWAPGTARRILTGTQPAAGSAPPAQFRAAPRYRDPDLQRVWESLAPLGLTDEAREGFVRLADQMREKETADRRTR